MNRVLNESLNFQNDRWKKVSSRAKKLLMIMLEKEKKRRATIEVIMKSDWMTQRKKISENKMSN